MRRLSLAISVSLLGAGCKAPAPSTPSTTPAPVVRTSTQSAFALTHDGPRPTFAHGKLSVFVSPAAADLDLGLPGVSFGDGRGPRYGLLCGYYAPQLLAPRSDRAYRSEIDASQDGLHIRFIDPDSGALALDATVRASPARVIVRGPARFALPADRVEVYGTESGAPAFSRPLRAGAEPGLDTRRADRVEVRSEKHGGHVVQTSCPRVHLVSPEHRGSTSAFVLGTGDKAPDDPLYAPIHAPKADVSPCAGTVTSTLWLPVAG